MKIQLELPWPPSVNSYWRRHGHVYFVSEPGRRFRKDVIRAVKLEKANHGLTGRLSIEVLASPPDRRTRDLDNILKSLFDSLKHADVYVDDEQIDILRVARMPISPPGSVCITVEEL